LGVSIQSATLIEEFSAHNVQHAIYNDTGPVRDVIVRDSRFTGVTYSGPWLTVDAPKERVLIERCVFEFAPDPGRDWIGFTLWDASFAGAAVTDIVVRDCVFRGTSARRFRPTSIQARVRDIAFLDNEVPPNSTVPVPQTGVRVEGISFHSAVGVE
jgi:hypothetical protein